jgi:hypothetical protein
MNNEKKNREKILARFRYEKFKERRKEKKRKMIEKIKEERLNNSIIFDNF